MLHRKIHDDEHYEEMMTHIPARTPKIKVIIAKSNRSRSTMYASEGHLRPAMALNKDVMLCAFREPE